MDNVKNERQSNFELLRIVCMLMIIGHHAAVHGGYPMSDALSVNDYLVRLFTIGGKLGVNMFVLISGYFLVNSKFRLSKVLKMFAQILFYSVILSSLFLILGRVEFSVHWLIYTFLPLTSNVWWFVSVYFIMYCLSPFLNILIKNCNNKLHLILIIFLVAIQCVTEYISGTDYLSNAAWFVTLYLIAAYIRLYPRKIFDSNKIALPIGLTLLVAIAALYVFVNVNLWDMTNIVCLLCSVAIFCAFKNFNIKNNKVINAIAKTTFGIYLLHDYPFMRDLLWKDLLKCPFHYQMNTYVCFVIAAVIATFAACMLIDFVRELLFKGVYCLINKLRRKPTDN